MAQPEAIAEVPLDRARDVRRDYLAYAATVASWFTGWGMQQVLFSGLVVLVLGMPAELVGTAQLALILPSILLILVGGAVADRLDRRRLLGWLHAAAGLTALLLAAAIALDRLSYTGLLVYALAMGTLSSFALPTRDALLSDVVRSPDMLRAVSGLTLTQFVAQSAGSLLAGVARITGWAVAAGLQAGVVLAGIAAVPRLPAGEAIERERVHPREVLSGVREVLASWRLLPVGLLVSGIGMFFMGPYFVVFPLLLRDYYGGAPEKLSLIFTMFPVGAVLVSLLLIRVGRIPRRGIAIALALGTAALALLIISTGPPFVWTLAAALLWGLCGGVFNNASRSVFQENAPPHHRARVLSAYSLALFGGGAIGAPLAGVLAGRLGPLGAFRTCGLAMIAFVIVVFLSTRLREVR